MPLFAQAATDLEALANEIESGRIVTDADRTAGAEFIRSRILDRTSRGVDVNGAPFEAYSASYAKRKDKAGGRVDQVDLYGIQHHPHMLNAMLTRTSDRGFEVGFYDDEPADRARWNNEGLGHLAERRFFAASDEDVDDVHAMIDERMDVRMNRK